MDIEASQLVGAHEIRELLKRAMRKEISRQRVYQLTRRPDFPEAVVELAQGKIWQADRVQTWISRHRSAASQPQTTQRAPMTPSVPHRQDASQRADTRRQQMRPASEL
jgi:hypothetical protein